MKVYTRQRPVKRKVVELLAEAWSTAEESRGPADVRRLCDLLDEVRGLLDAPVGWSSKAEARLYAMVMAENGYTVDEAAGGVPAGGDDGDE